MKITGKRWQWHLIFWCVYWILMSLYSGLYDGQWARAATAQALELPLRIGMVYLVFWRMPTRAHAHWWRWLLESGVILLLSTLLYRLLMYRVVYPLCYQSDYTFEFWNAYRFSYMLLDLSFTLFLAILLRLLRKNMQSEPPQPLSVEPPLSPPDTTPEALLIKVNKQQIRVLLSEIVYIESRKEYSKIHLKHRSWVTQITLAELERRLPERQFVRIHRSYIVHRQKITAYSASEVVLDQVVLPIGRTYKGVAVLG